MCRNTKKAIFGDTFYANELNDICDNYDQMISGSGLIIQSLADNSRLFRDLVFFWWSRGYVTVATSPHQHGIMYILLEFVLGRKGRVVFLEFIRGELPDNRIKRYFYPVFLRLFLKPIFKKIIRFAHVLSEYEVQRYAAMYGISESSFVFIPWPLVFPGDSMPEKCVSEAHNHNYVLVSGRAACDWETFFKASYNQDWSIVVICSTQDKKRVCALDINKQAKIYFDLPVVQHRKFVQEAAVYVLSLQERYYSAGHIRLSECTRAGTPVVATDVCGLRDYIIRDETAVVVPPSNPEAMRHAVNELLNNQARGRMLARQAYASVGDYDRSIYMKRVRTLLLDK